MRMGILVVAAFLAPASVVLSGANRVTLTGKVTDATGNPVEHATVMVNHAGVKKGYSTYCPSCYADCGKRVMTDAAGKFSIESLDPDLWFKLLVVHDGYAPVFVEKVDPCKGPSATAVLTVRVAVDDPARVARGRVVDPHGMPVRDAVVEPQGVTAIFEGQKPADMYGEIMGLDPVAVTNSKGEFEIAYAKPALKMLLLVEARGMSPKLISMPTGAERHTVTVSDGATIRGRLVNDSKPVAGAEVGLFPRNPFFFGPGGLGSPYSEIRIGTQEDGSFAITNVPAPVDWYIYGKMDSIATRGATEPIECATKRDDEEVDVGDIQVKPGHRLRGKVVLSDGKPVPEGMRIIIASDRDLDSQTALLGTDGHFEFRGLPTGKYAISPAVKDYQLPQQTLEASIDRDIDSLVIVLHPVRRAPSQR